MGRITSSIGLATGLNIEETVNKLIALSAQPRDLATVRRTAIGTQQAAITDLTALTLGVQLAARRLKNDSNFTKSAVTSSSTLIAAFASGPVAPGNYQFTAVRQAQNAQLLSAGLAAKDEPLGAGTFSFRFGGAITQAIDLSELNGGNGVTTGKIRLTDRNGTSAVIDLRFAQTTEDVIAAINNNDDIEITASLRGDRLHLQDRSGGAGNLRVQEVGGGTTAAGLGIASINVAADSALGNDVLRLSSGLSLDRLNDGNGLSIRTGVSDLNVTFRDGTSLEIDFNRVTPPRTEKTLGELLATINEADPARLQAAISADGDHLVFTDLTTNTGGTFAVASTAGGSVAEDLGLTGAASGATLTSERLTGGLQSPLLRTLGGGNGLGTLGEIDLTDRSGATATINLASAETLDDVLTAINGSGLGLRAEINAARNGLQIVDTTGATASNLIIANGDATNTATKLGLVANVAEDSVRGSDLARQLVNEHTLLADYNAGRGVAKGAFTITNSQGISSGISFTTLNPETIGDVIDAINGLSIEVTAKINDAGDGIALIDQAGGAQRLTVANAGSGKTATDLHLTTASVDTTIGGNPAQLISGSTAYRVTLDADDDLVDLATKLNNLGAGLTASVVSDTSGTLRHRLSLSSNVDGLAGDLLVDGSALGLKFQTLTAAQDALLGIGSAAGGRVISSSTNHFEDAIEGLDLTLNGASTDSVSISATTTSSDIESAVQLFVDQYNKLREKITSYTFFNEQDNSKGTLFGSSEVLRLESEVSRAVTQQYFATGSIRSFNELGISADERGKLTFDKTRLQQRFAADPEALKEFFADETNGFAAKVDGALERLVGRDNSTLVNRARTLQTQLEDATSRVDTLTKSLDRQRERLLLQFYNMELVISKIKSNLSSIESIQYISSPGS